MSYRQLTGEERVGLRVLVRAAEEERARRLSTVEPELRIEQCAATTRYGAQCSNSAEDDSDYCRVHHDGQPEPVLPHATPPPPDLADRLLDQLYADVEAEVDRYYHPRRKAS